jgi:hypothetical protein
MRLNGRIDVLIIDKFREQIKSNLKLIIILVTLFTTFFGIVSAYCLRNGVSLSLYIRVVAAITGVSPFIGIISNVGIALWCATVAITLFTILIVTTGRIEESKMKFLKYSLFLNTFMFLDDALMFHEYVFPRVLGIRETMFYIFYASFVLFLLLRFYKVILSEQFILMFLGLTGFALSVFFDKFEDLISFQQTFEDFFKFLGIAFWCSFFIKVSKDLLITQFKQAR